jgi:high affinity Mn2+ porin
MLQYLAVPANRLVSRIMPAMLFAWLSWVAFSPVAEAIAGEIGVQSAAASKSGSLPTDPASIDVTPAYRVLGQFTYVTQGYPSFTASYSGQNSLDPKTSSAETLDVTLFAGMRLSENSEVWADAELDQGFGLSDTLGMAGFPSGEAYKVGANEAYLRLPRLFYRKVVGLGGTPQPVDVAANQMAGFRVEDNVVLTLGKFSVADVFDTNRYAHDPRQDFLNWSIIESGAFDYAADAWGYAYGASAEWTRQWWTLRGGFFDLSKAPNGKVLDASFKQYEVVTELEERHRLGGRAGRVKLLLFDNRAKMGSYADAVNLAEQTNTLPEMVNVRHDSSQGGMAINVEQELSSGFGGFARVSRNEGAKEAYDFTDINRSVSAGISVQGNRWRRDRDTLGFAAAVNGLSSAAQQYFAAGGMGILIGDGQLAHYGLEKISEIYYLFGVTDSIRIAADFQYVINPAYNRDRGPISIFGARIHCDF